MIVRKNGRVLDPSDTDLSNYTITIRKEGNNVIAMAERKSNVGNIWSGFNNESISFSVFVPTAYSTKLGTSGGSIHAQGIRGDVDVSTSGGSIRLSDVDGEMSLRTSGGSIRIEDSKGSVDGSTSGGSISANFAMVTGPIELSTSGGSVSVTIPEGVGFNLDARGSRVVADDLSLNGRYDRDRISGTVNGGGIPIRLRTSAGTIRIQHP
jgi:DUF4097 and DUF4098 domain-containing protein YvlB